MRTTLDAAPKTPTRPLCAALRAALRPSPQSAGLLALHGPALGQSLELSTLDGTKGFVLKGIDLAPSWGSWVSGGGDINGDGLDDVAIGSPGAWQSHVVFGRTGGFGAALELSALDGTNGFVLNGLEASDQTGSSVSGAGDVNVDGIDDLLIGAPGAGLSYSPYSSGAAGESYVVFGRTGGFPAALELSALNGANGFVLNGVDANDWSGTSVSGAGDVNGDGIDDLLIGAPGPPGFSSSGGESYVVFGRTGGFAAALELSTPNGSNGFVLKGIDANDGSGGSVSGAGDVNGDGIDDLLIGTRYADPGGRNSAGESYVVFGRTGGFPAALKLSALDGTNGFVLNGVDANDGSGDSVSGAGDVNGDGVDDLLIGSFGFKYGTASTTKRHVVFGGPDVLDNPRGRLCRTGSAIPDGDPIGITDTLTTFGDGLLADIDVEIRATHSWVGDLVFELEHATRRTTAVVGLIDRPGLSAAPPHGCWWNDIDAVLDDQAASPVQSECAPAAPTISGRFTPSEPLSLFSGEAVGGTWTLTAIDMADLETGTLNQWCLVPWYQPPTLCAGVDLPLVQVSFSGVETCLGENSLTARDTRVSNTADVAFLSPSVTLGRGFRVETCAIFSVARRAPGPVSRGGWGIQMSGGTPTAGCRAHPCPTYMVAQCLGNVVRHHSPNPRSSGMAAPPAQPDG